MTCSGCSGAVERVLGRMKDKGKCEQSTTGKLNFGALESVLCREVVYMVSFFGESFNRGSTVFGSPM